MIPDCTQGKNDSGCHHGHPSKVPVFSYTVEFFLMFIQQFTVNHTELHQHVHVASLKNWVWFACLNVFSDKWVRLSSIACSCQLCSFSAKLKLTPESKYIFARQLHCIQISVPWSLTIKNLCFIVENIFYHKSKISSKKKQTKHGFTFM